MAKSTPSNETPNNNTNEGGQAARASGKSPSSKAANTVVSDSVNPLGQALPSGIEPTTPAPRPSALRKGLWPLQGETDAAPSTAEAPEPAPAATSSTASALGAPEALPSSPGVLYAQAGEAAAASSGASAGAAGGAAASAGTAAAGTAATAAAASMSWFLPIAAVGAAAVASSGGKNNASDSTAPSAPLLGIASDTQELTVTAEAGSTVTVVLTGSSGNVVIKTLTGTGAAQVVTLTEENKAALGSGYASVSVSAKDAGGNTSPVSSSSLGLSSVSDGYIQGAEVYLDKDHDGTVSAGDEKVGTTDDHGNFSALLTAQQMTYDLITRGGTDVSTGLAYTGMLKASAGSTVLNPLTTLVQTLTSTGTSLTEAQTTVIQALNLPSNIDLGKLDLLKIGVGGTNSDTSISQADALDMQAKAVMVANMVKTGAAAIQGAAADAASATGADKFVYQGLVDTLKTAAQTGQAVNFADASTVKDMLSAAVSNAQSKVSIDTSIIDTSMNLASNALANVNQVITLAAGSAAAQAQTQTDATQKTSNIAQAMTDMLKAQVVAQQSIATSLVTGDTSTLATLDSASAIVQAAQSVDASSLKLTKDVSASTTAVSADTTGPTAIKLGLVNPNANLKPGDNLVFEVGFSEGVLVTGVPTVQFQIGGSNRTANYSSTLSSGSVMRLVYKISDADLGGITMPTALTLPGGATVTDLSANAATGLGSLPSGNTAATVTAYTFDTGSGDSIAPTVTITSSATGSVAKGDVTLTFSFSEKVVGFTPDDVSLTGNVFKGPFTANPDGKTFTLVVKPMGGNEGSFTASLLNATVKDLAGNAYAPGDSPSAGNSISQAFDTQPPMVVNMGASNYWLSSANSNSATLKFVFSDAPAEGSLSISDFSVTGGTLSNLTPAAGSTDGKTYTVTFTASSELSAGSKAAIALKQGAFQDVNGNDSLASGSIILTKQPQLTQSFITVAGGKTSAFANNNTPNNTSDDVQGSYNVQTTDTVSFVYFPKPGSTLPSNTELINKILTAATPSAFNDAVNAARAVMDLNFGVDLGNSKDITGDGNNDKGAAANLIYKTTGSGDGLAIVFASDAAQSVGVQPVVLSSLPSWLQIGTGKTGAFSNNGTFQNMADDKQGTYTLLGNEVGAGGMKLQINMAPKAGSTLESVTNLQSLIDGLRNATDATAFNSAMSAATAKVDVFFNLLLGDGTDITKDGVADKGSSANLMYSAPVGGVITLKPDSSVADSIGVQPVVLTQSFIEVSKGLTNAYSNNGTPMTSADDTQGTYTLTGTEKITIMAAPFPNSTLPANAALLLNAIKSATSISAMTAAVANAKAVMQLNYGINLGDNIDITGDGLADKGSTASLSIPVVTSDKITFGPNAGAAQNAALQPLLIDTVVGSPNYKSFVTLTTGSPTFAFSNNGTPTNSADDKQGTYTLNGSDKISVYFAPKADAPLDTPAKMDAAKAAIQAISGATSASGFKNAVDAARALIEVNFGVNLGDGVDITSDGLADKGANASLVYTATNSAITFSADTGAAQNAALQPIVLNPASKTFLQVVPGQTFAFSNNGTPTNSADDRQGTYTLKSTDKVTVYFAPKPNTTLDMTAAKAALAEIDAATTATTFAQKVAAARDIMEVNFSINLGDGLDITGDLMPDKGSNASVVYSVSANGNNILFSADTGAAQNAALQPVVLDPSTKTFLSLVLDKDGNGVNDSTFAFSNNGTPTNSADDKQGSYTLKATDKITVNFAPLPNTTLNVDAAKMALDSIAKATTAQAFTDAVNAARALMDVNFNINLGDGVDITGDGLADKGSGASLVYTVTGSGNSTAITFSADTGAAQGAALQPLTIDPRSATNLQFMTLSAPDGNKTFAYSNNGTPNNSADDKQGTYSIKSTDKVTLYFAPKADAPLDTSAKMDAAKAAVTAIANATTASEFKNAIDAARALIEVNFGVNLGDGVDITGDGIADKGAGAMLTYTGTDSAITFAGDSSAAQNAALQPIVIDPSSATFKSYMTVGTGATFAFSNNGTPTNSADDKQGSYTLKGTEKITINYAPKANTTLTLADIESAKTALTNLATADTMAKFTASLATARTLLDVNFAVNLGDGVDITNDGVADKGSGASLMYTIAGDKITFGPDAGAAQGAALQPIVIDPNSSVYTSKFITLTAGPTVAYANNGTPTIGSDDKRGNYTVKTTDKITLNFAPKADFPLDTPEKMQAAQTAAKNIALARTASDFDAAVVAARALIEVNFGVNLGDSTDITNDGVADKGASATLTYTPSESAITFGGDSTAAQGAALQPVVIDRSIKTFVGLGSGTTFAFSNNGTPSISADDKQGTYTLKTTDKITISFMPKSGTILSDTTTANAIASALSAISSASSPAGFASAITTASNLLDLNYSVNLGDGVDITNDGIADKGSAASLVPAFSGSGDSTVISFNANTSAAQSAALQPIVLDPSSSTRSFLTLPVGQTTSAKSNNGTPTISSDDTTGTYKVQTSDKISITVAPKSGTPFPADAQDLLNAIGSAVDSAGFATAVTSASERVDVKFGISLGDGVDITGDKVADKGSTAQLAFLGLDGSSIKFGSTDKTPPSLTTVNPLVLGFEGTKVVLNFSEALNSSTVPDKSRFNVTVDDSLATISDPVVINGSQVLLTMSTPIAWGAKIQVTYSDPNPNSNDVSGVLQDAAGNDVASFFGDVSGYNLADGTDATKFNDKVEFELGESTLHNMIQLLNFNKTNDVLSLPYSIIASNTGITAGTAVDTFAKHSISNGLVKFYTSNDQELIITPENSSYAAAYIQTNIPHATGAMWIDTNKDGTPDSTAIFQCEGAVPGSSSWLNLPATVVLLPGQKANGISNTFVEGMVTVQDHQAPEPISMKLNSSGVTTPGTLQLFFAEPIDLTGMPAHLYLNGGAEITPLTKVYSQENTILTLVLPGTVATSDWVMLSYQPNSENFLSDRANNVSIPDGANDSVAIGSDGANQIDLHTVPKDGKSYDLLGHGGHDTLIGSPNKDAIFGGAGGDSLTGGDGADWFYFEQGDSRQVTFDTETNTFNLAFGSINRFDRITDFSAGDKITLSQVLSNIVGGDGMKHMQPGTLADQSYFAVQGVLNESNGTFKPDNSDSVAPGNKTLIVWDGNWTSAITPSAIVLDNTTLAQLTLADGYITHL